MELTQTIVTPDEPINHKLNFLLLIFGRLVSSLGANVFSFALSLYVLDITGSAATFATILSLSVIPNIIINVIAGVYVDKHDQKKIMVISDIASGLIGLIFLLIFLYKPREIGIFILYVLITGSIGAFFGMAVNAAIPRIVEKKDVVRVNSTNQAIGAVISIIGPVLGALAYKSLGLKVILLANGLLLITAGILEMFIVFQRRPLPEEHDSSPHPRASYLDDIRLTFKFLQGNKIIAFFLVFAAVADFALIPMTSLVIPYINYHILKVSGFQLSLLQASLAAGTIIGAIIISIFKSNQFYMKRFFIFFNIQALLIMLWVFPKVPLLSGSGKWVLTVLFSSLLLFFGMFNAIQNIPMITHFQLELPENYRARIFGIFVSALYVTSPIGIWLYGVFLEKINWGLVTTVTGFLLLSLGTFSARNKYYLEFKQQLEDSANPSK